MAMEMTRESDWREFIDKLIEVLGLYENLQINYRETSKIIESYRYRIVEGWVIDELDNCISEIGGSPGNFMKLKAYIERRPSEEALAKFLREW
jgi:hypothetical protein